MRVLLTGVRRRRAALRAVLFVSLLALAQVAAEPATPQPASIRPEVQPVVAPTKARASHGTPRAATLADYRVRVRRAFQMLEGLARVYEGEDGGKSEKGAGGPEEVRGLLPLKERVEWGDRVIEVDNAWLHESLGKLESEEDEEKLAEVLLDAAGRLRSLEARLAELEGGAAAGLDRDAERGRLNAILRAPEFDRQAPRQGNALQRLVEWIVEWVSDILRWLFGSVRVAPGASTGVSRVAQLLVFGLCLAVLLYVARRVWRRRGLRPKSLGLKRGARVVLGERLEADQTAADLLEEAERLARGGELRGAIRKAYVALLCELGDRGVLRLAQHKTNRDYLNAVRRASRPHLYTEMLPLTSDFELHWYGLHDASDADWESFKTRCRRAIKETVDRSQ